MAKRKTEKVLDREDELIRKIGDCELVIREVEGSEAWKILLRDLEQTRKNIDGHWHLLAEKEKLDELRITKLAVNQILGLIDTYRHDLAMAKQELHNIRNPNEVLNKYYDTESNYENRSQV